MGNGSVTGRDCLALWVTMGGGTFSLVLLTQVAVGHRGHAVGGRPSAWQRRQGFHPELNWDPCQAGAPSRLDS